MSLTQQPDPSFSCSARLSSRLLPFSSSWARVGGGHGMGNCSCQVTPLFRYFLSFTQTVPFELRSKIIGWLHPLDLTWSQPLGHEHGPLFMMHRDWVEGAGAKCLIPVSQGHPVVFLHLDHLPAAPFPGGKKNHIWHLWHWRWGQILTDQVTLCFRRFFFIYPWNAEVLISLYHVVYGPLAE